MAGSRINSKKKGAKNERGVCQLLKKWTGYDFARVPQSGGLRWKKTDNITGDLVCTDPQHKFPFSIEAKFHKDINFSHLLYNVDSEILKFWSQCEEDAIRGKKIPMLFMRYNSLPKDFHFIAIYLKHFLELTNEKILQYKRPYLICKVDGRSLVIITSSSLFKNKYKPFYKWARKKLKALGSAGV